MFVTMTETLSLAYSIVEDNDIAILVLARSSSRRVLNKNYRPFFGPMSMVDVKMNTLSCVFPPDNVFISSDIHDNIYNNLHRSSESLLDNTLSFTDVITPLYNDLRTGGFKHVLITYPTSPLFNEDMYRKVIYEYATQVINGPFSSMATGHYENGYYWQGNKEVNYNATAEGHAYTQDNGKLFCLDNAVYIKELKHEESHYMFNRESVHFVEIPKLFGLDVDSKEDFIIAQELYKSYKSDKFNGVY